MNVKEVVLYLNLIRNHTDLHKLYINKVRKSVNSRYMHSIVTLACVAGGFKGWAPQPQPLKPPATQAIVTLVNISGNVHFIICGNTSMIIF
jgi:hypothetical protein